MGDEGDEEKGEEERKRRRRRRRYLNAYIHSFSASLRKLSWLDEPASAGSKTNTTQPH